MLLHRKFIETARKNPQKIAIRDELTLKEITYQKALIAALVLSRKLKKHREGCIGIMIPTSMGCSLAIIGTLLAGKVPVMINYSTGADDNCEYAQRRCAFRTILTSRALLERIGCRWVKGFVFIEDIIEHLSITDKLWGASLSKMPVNFILKNTHQGNPNDNAAILFTSGSEKAPKAVQLTHQNLWSNISDSFTAMHLKSSYTFFANLPFFHVFGLALAHWLPLTHGMTMLSYANPLEYRKNCDIIRRQKPDVMISTPTFMQGYFRKAQAGDLESLKFVVAGADMLPESLRRAFEDKHNLTVYQGYGTTETSPVISTNNQAHHRPGSVGKPYPSLHVRIVDHESGQELPAGQEGKILVKGPSVMKGYYRDLEETSLHLRDGWYDTGDMGILDDEGYLWHRGRLKRFTKIGGEMVSLRMVECALEVLLDEGVDCCVVAIPDSNKGSKIVAVVTAPLKERKIQKKLAETLPTLALPKKYIVWEHIAKLGSGKVDFRRVTQLVTEQEQELLSA